MILSPDDFVFALCRIAWRLVLLILIVILIYRLSQYDFVCSAIHP